MAEAESESMSALMMLAPGATPFSPAALLAMMPATPVGWDATLPSPSTEKTSTHWRPESTAFDSSTAASTSPPLTPRAWTVVAPIEQVLVSSSGVMRMRPP